MAEDCLRLWSSSGVCAYGRSEVDDGSSFGIGTESVLGVVGPAIKSAMEQYRLSSQCRSYGMPISERLEMSKPTKPFYLPSLPFRTFLLSNGSCLYGSTFQAPSPITVNVGLNELSLTRRITPLPLIIQIQNSNPLNDIRWIGSLVRMSGRDRSPLRLILSPRLP